MGVKRNTDSGIGEYTEAPPAPRTCCKCGGPWDVPRMVRSHGDHHKYGSQQYVPHPNGDGICWECWDKGDRT